MGRVALVLKAFENRNTVDAAEEFIRGLTRAIGPGFHPDTSFQDYLDVLDKYQRTLTDAAADVLDHELDRAILILGNAGVDPCAVAAPVQRNLLSTPQLP